MTLARLVTGVATFITGTLLKLLIGLAMALATLPFKLLGFVVRRRRHRGPPASHSGDGPRAPR